MSKSAAVAPIEQTRRWSDRLVERCLEGNEEAWGELVAHYKNLIYSIPIKYGFKRDEAADIFQAVCLDLVAELPRVRDVRALPKWLIQTTAHKCYHWKRTGQRRAARAEMTLPADVAGPPGELPEEMMRAFEREQALRDAIAALPPRCQRLIQMLFQETPARPYREIAQQLGIAIGSVGFIRMRCLEQLRVLLTRMGL